MKLVAVTGYYEPAYVYGGPVRSQAAMYEGLKKLGVDVTVITTNANGNTTLDVPLLKSVDVGGVEVIYCPVGHRIGTRFYSSTQIEWAKRNIMEADVVNLQTIWGYATPLLTQHCLNQKIPYFISLRGQLMDYSMKGVSLFKRLKKLLFLNWKGYHYFNSAAALHCTSQVEVAHLRRYPIHAPTFIVPNSIDLSKFWNLPPRGEIRSQYNLPNDALVLVMLGRIHETKNPQIGVSVLAAAQNLPTEVHLFIIGPDEDKLQPALEKQARQGRCYDKLHFTELVQPPDTLKFLADADLLLMPSNMENFGMSAAEALAAGVPIVTSELVPVGEWAKAEGAGLTAPSETEAFCATVLSILSDRTRLEQMRTNTRKAAAHFDNDTISKDLLAELEKLTEDRRKRRIRYT